MKKKKEMREKKKKEEIQYLCTYAPPRVILNFCGC